MSDALVPPAGADGAGDDDVLDVVGIGFGPSNLALAIAATEQAAADPRQALRVGFLERQPRFGWHRGMLIDDATMQVSFLKDLVTLRNPTSDFSFVCYLHERGRLVDFINHKTLFPLAHRVPRLPRVGRGAGRSTSSPTGARWSTSSRSPTATWSSPATSSAATPAARSPCSGPATWPSPPACSRACRRA